MLILLIMEASFIPIAAGFALKGLVFILRAGFIYPTPEGGWLPRRTKPVQYWCVTAFIGLMIASGLTLALLHAASVLRAVRAEVGI